MEQPKMELMLQLMKLLSGAKELTIEELSQKLSTGTRTIYRYIESLKEAGFVVKKVRPNVYRVVKMPLGTSRLSNLMFFSREESQFLENLFKEADASYSLKCSTRNKLGAIYDSMDLEPYLSRKSDAPKVEPILQAIRHKRQIVMHSYRHEATGARVDITAEPYEFLTGFEKVWAFDVKSLDNVLLDLSRASEVELLDKRWVFSKNHEPGFLDIFGNWGKEQHIVKLSLSDRAADILLREHPTSSPYLTRAQEGNILEAAVTSFEGVARFCIGLSKEVSILESPELISYVRNFVQGYLSQYLSEE